MRAALIGLLCVGLLIAATMAALRFIDPTSDAAMVAIAAGTATGTTLALTIAAATVYGTFRAFLPWLTAIRALFAGAAALAVARAIQSYLLSSHAWLVTILALIAAVIVYGVALAVTREIGRAELDALRKVLDRKR